MQIFAIDTIFVLAIIALSLLDHAGTDGSGGAKSRAETNSAVARYRDGIPFLQELIRFYR